METVDMTPTWRQLLPTWLSMVSAPNEEIHTNFAAEMRRMAQAADFWQGLIRSADERWARLTTYLRMIAAGVAVPPRGHTVTVAVAVALSSQDHHQLDKLEEEVRSFSDAQWIKFVNDPARAGVSRSLAEAIEAVRSAAADG